MACHGLHVWSLYMSHCLSHGYHARALGLVALIIEKLQGQCSKLKTSFCPLWSLNRHLSHGS